MPNNSSRNSRKKESDLLSPPPPPKPPPPPPPPTYQTNNQPPPSSTAPYAKEWADLLSNPRSCMELINLAKLLSSANVLPTGIIVEHNLSEIHRVSNIWIHIMVRNLLVLWVTGEFFNVLVATDGLQKTFALRGTHNSYAVI